MERGLWTISFRRGEFAGRTGADPLVLLDINIPGSVGGVEVLRQIKADPATCTTPVIMLSTTDDPREVALCYELGCSVYITKPVDPLQFIEASGGWVLFSRSSGCPRAVLGPWRSPRHEQHTHLGNSFIP